MGRPAAPSLPFHFQPRQTPTPLPPQEPPRSSSSCPSPTPFSQPLHLPAAAAGDAIAEQPPLPCRCLSPLCDKVTGRGHLGAPRARSPAARAGHGKGGQSESRWHGASRGKRALSEVAREWGAQRSPCAAEPGPPAQPKPTGSLFQPAWRGFIPKLGKHGMKPAPTHQARSFKTFLCSAFAEIRSGYKVLTCRL